MGQLVEELGLAQPMVSQHLRVLRGARMVATRRRKGRGSGAASATSIAHILGDAMKHTQEGNHDHDH